MLKTGRNSFQETNVTGTDSFLDRVMKGLAWFAGWLMTATIVMVCLDVLMRYFFNDPIPGVLQFSEYVLLYMPFLAAGYVLKEESHIKIDIVLIRLSPGTQAFLNMVTSILCFAVLMVLFYYGAFITLDYFIRGVPVLKYYKIPEFLVVMVIPFGCFIFALQFIRRAYSFYRDYREILWNGGKR